MINIKRLSIDELKEAALLSNSVFRSEGQEWMEVAFPYIFKPSLVSHSFGAFEGRELHSFMGLVPFTLKIGQAKLPVFSLGSVCTLPSARGKGYASQLLEDVKQYIDQAGASLLFISGDRGLYTRADCHHFGSAVTHLIQQQDAHLLKEKAQGQMQQANKLQQREHLHHESREQQLSSEGFSPETHTLREYQSTDLLQMVELANSRIAHYETSIHDFTLLLEAGAFARDPKLKHKILVAEKNGQISAFVVVGIPAQQEEKAEAIATAGDESAKAGDTTGAASAEEAGDTAGNASAVAIEWAGEASAVAMLLAEALQRYEAHALEVTMLWQERELLDILLEWKKEATGNQGTVYIVHPERLLEQLGPYLIQQNEEISSQLSIHSVDGGLTQISLGEEKLTLHPDQLVKLLFSEGWLDSNSQGWIEQNSNVGNDPMSKESLDPRMALSENMRQGLQKVFPIPLPYTAGLQYI